MPHEQGTLAATPEVTDDAATTPPARRTYRESLRALGGAQKSGKGAPAYSRYINRRLGRFLAAAAFQLGLTPDSVTAFSALFSFAAIAMLAVAPPSVALALAVTFGLVLGYALDSADGQLARLRGGGSISGEWLDHMIDATKISSLHLAVLISAYRFMDLPSTAWLLVPLGFTVVAAVSFFGMILNEQLRRSNAVPKGTAVAVTSTLRSLLVIPTDYGVLCLVFLLLGSPLVFFGAYSLLFVGCAGYLLLASVKWFRDMRKLDAQR